MGSLCGVSIYAADVLEDALIAAWLFDENGGDTAEDVSGNGHDGDIIDAKTGAGQDRQGTRFRRKR